MGAAREFRRCSQGEPGSRPPRSPASKAWSFGGSWSSGFICLSGGSFLCGPLEESANTFPGRLHSLQVRRCPRGMGFPFFYSSNVGHGYTLSVTERSVTMTERSVTMTERQKGIGAGCLHRRGEHLHGPDPFEVSEPASDRFLAEAGKFSEPGVGCLE